MKALTLHQPWASLISVGVKTIETRSWPTKYRGPLLIHAGKQFVEKGYDGSLGGWLARVSSYSGAPYLLAPGTWPGSGALDWNERLPIPLELPLGAIVASCKLVDCVPIVVGGEEGAVRTLDVDDNGSLWIVEAQTDEEAEEQAAEWVEVTDEMPYGDFTPGRFAWLLEDIKPTTERCPACWGRSAYHDEYNVDCCAVCECQGTCGPLPAKGKQGLWEWTA